MSDYCHIAPGHAWHGPYHDREYGFPLRGERALLERLSLEIFQAGLSWLIILKKRRGICAAFDNFNPDIVAAYGARDVARLLKDARIIRNRLKVAAIIHNAGVVVGMRESGGFARWLAHHHPRDKAAWVALFKKTFRFTGGEITGEFLMSTGFLPGAHRPSCPVYKKILEKNPPWRRAKI